MSSNFSILSTKKLTAAQKERLMSFGAGCIIYQAIDIDLLDVKIDEEIQNAIFTSKNAVRAIENSAFKIQYCFCVGENTKKLLEEKGYNVIEVAQNASELGEIISKRYKNEEFCFFCGNLRRDELPSILKENDISCKETVVYKTIIKSKKFHRTFDGILFFSPSGVQSYTTNNTIGDSVAFCIGTTTASEVKKYTDTIIIANKPTVENVIVQAVKYFDKRI